MQACFVTSVRSLCFFVVAFRFPCARQSLPFPIVLLVLYAEGDALTTGVASSRK